MDAMKVRGEVAVGAGEPGVCMEEGAENLWLCQREEGQDLGGAETYRRPASCDGPMAESW